MSGKEVQRELSEELYNHLQQFNFALINTVTKEKTPYTSAISWIYATEKGIIRFAVDSKSPIIENINENPEVALTVFINDSVYAIYGRGNQLVEEIEGIPFKLATVEIKISEVFDAMFYGARLTSIPQYEKTYNNEAAEKLDNQVLEALKA